MAKDPQEKLSDDTIVCLEQAKKGKPRKFVLVSKGAAIVSMVVYKKGSLEKFKKEAKEAGTGQVCYGVVTGSGMELNFQLARSDGFERPPVKTITLKEYLSEKGDFRCKPLIEIVDAPLAVLDDEDPAVKRFLALQPAALAACDNHADRAAEINSLCEQIGKLLESEQPEQATAKLTELEKLLASLGPSAAAPSASAQPDGTAAFTARLSALKPDLEKALAAKSPAAEELKLLVSQAGYHARKKEFAEANALLDQVEAGLKKLPAGEPLAATWDRRRGDVEPKFAAFASTAPPDTVQKLQKILDLATAKAAAQDFKTALQAIDQLEPLLVAKAAAVPPTGSTPASDEQFAARARQLRQTWVAAKETVDQQITALKKAMKGTGDVVFARLAEYGLAGVTKRLQTSLVASLLNLETARGEARQKTLDQALKAIADFQQLLAGEKSIELVEANPFGVQVGIRTTLGSALSEMERSLKA